MFIPFFLIQILSLKNTILKLIEAEIENTEYFVVGVKSNEAETQMQFYIDGIEGAPIGICARVSRRVSAQLDEMELGDERFQYEISSPGVDNPLVDKRQYPQHIGRTLEVNMIDGSILEGELKVVEDEEIELKITLDKKKKTTETKRITFKEIDNSKVQISFKRVKK